MDLYDDLTPLLTLKIVDDSRGNDHGYHGSTRDHITYNTFNKSVFLYSLRTIPRP